MKKIGVIGAMQIEIDLLLDRLFSKRLLFLNRFLLDRTLGRNQNL
ncbi:hypothetical protein RCG23_09430 [Neobacillus sp. PS3-34]|nr:hypothetical protein [Neobacillus sp. PS3-34]WML50040.1 hypothetical protein RCG23_09430 [Neobacillus sp. PS3-34]